MVRGGKAYYDPRLGMVAHQSQMKYRARSYEVSGAPVLERTPETQRLFVTLYSAWVYERLQHERQVVAAATSQRLPEIPRKNIEQYVREITNGAISIHELDKQQRIDLTKLSSLATYFDEGVVPDIPRNMDRHHHKRRRGFNPAQSHHKNKHHRRRDWRREGMR